MTERAPRRVLLVTAVVGGGVGRHVRQLAAGLTAVGHQVVVACPAEVAARFDLSATGARVEHVELGSGLRDGWRAGALLALRRVAGGADVVHAHGLRAGAAAALVTGRNGPPVVVTSHNAPPAGAAGLVYAVLERLVCRRADLLLGVSPDLVDRARTRGARATGLAVVPSEVHRPLTDDERASAREDLRRELGLGEDRLVVVAAGRLAPQKRMGVVVRAFQQAVQHLVGADQQVWGRDVGQGSGPAGAGSGEPVLVIAGDGPDAERLRGLAGSGPGEVRWLGRREDVPQLLAAADVVVSASVWEGQPLVLQEALAAGAPIIATDVGGSALVVGDAAVLVSGDEPAVGSALSGALADLLRDSRRREQLSARALDRASQLPSAKDALEDARRHYRRLLSH